jgi:hypothetical protein
MMKTMKAVALALGGLAAAGHAADAAPIGFSFNAGPIISIGTFGPNNLPLAPLRGFEVGEDLLVTFSIESETADSDDRSGSGKFQDLGGSISIRGLTTNTVLDLVGGADVEFSNTRSFELDSALETPAPRGTGTPFTFALADDIDFLARQGFNLWNPNNLEASLATIETAVEANGGDFPLFNVATVRGSTATIVSTGRNGNTFVVMEFGPARSSVTPVPLPATAWMLFFAIAGAFGIQRWRRD